MPFQVHHIAETVYFVGVVVRHVAPHHGGQSAATHVGANLLHVGKVGFAVVVERMFAVNGVKRFVATDVEQSRVAESRQHVIKQASDKPYTVWVGRVQRSCRAMQAVLAPIETVRRIGKTVVLRLIEPIGHVSVAVAARHKRNKALFGVFFKRDYVGGGKIIVGARVTLRLGRVVERTPFDIQLQHVHFDVGQIVDKFFERGKRRHLITRNVQHKAAADKVRLVMHAHKRKFSLALLSRLQKSKHGVMQSRLRSILHRYARFVYGNDVCLRP